MKKICLFAILLMAALGAAAETHVSIVAAPQFDDRIGVRAGLDADFSLGSSNFSFVPGLYWSMRSFCYSVKAEGKTVFDATDRSHWLSVPLRFAYNFSKGSEKFQTQLLFGPYVAVGLGGTTSITAPENKKVGSFDKKNGGIYDRRFDVGFNVGVNFIIKKHLVLGAFGEIGFMPLGNLGRYSVLEAFALPFTNNLAFGINIGYRF